MSEALETLYNGYHNTGCSRKVLANYKEMLFFVCYALEFHRKHNGYFIRYFNQTIFHSIDYEESKKIWIILVRLLDIIEHGKAL